MALSGTSNKSAPGPSGINYKLVKWAFKAHPDLIPNIFNTTLCLGHHPWTTEKVVILLKPVMLQRAYSLLLVSESPCNTPLVPPLRHPPPTIQKYDTHPHHP